MAVYASTAARFPGLASSIDSFVAWRFMALFIKAISMPKRENVV
jgi:hypothetical protein